MKKVLMIGAILPTMAKAQVYFQMRTGWSVNTSEYIVSPSVSFQAHNISLQPEMIVYPKRDQPAEFGVKASCQYKFVEAGAGRYFALYSTDKFDEYRNCFANQFFVAGHYKKYFLQYGYDTKLGHLISVGVKLNVAKTEYDENN
jgi:hypothetical protein